MSVDLTKLVNLQGLVNFKQRQDASNESKFLQFAHITSGSNNTIAIGTDNSGGYVEALTASSSISAANLTGTVNSNVTVPASTISGVIDIQNIPAAALERIVTVESIAARNALTTSSVQLGDVVHVYNTTSGSEINKMFMVVDESNLDGDSGYKEFVAGSAASVPWTGVTGKPTIGNGSSYDIASGSHTHSSSDVTAMTSYSKPVTLTVGHEAIETTDSLNAAIGKLENKVDANATAIAADIASSKVSAMTGYSKPNSLTSGHEAVETTDTLNQAVGKLEYKLDETIANVASNAEIDEEIFGIVAQNSGD